MKTFLTVIVVLVSALSAHAVTRIDLSPGSQATIRAGDEVVVGCSGSSSSSCVCKVEYFQAYYRYQVTLNGTVIGGQQGYGSSLEAATACKRWIRGQDTCNP